MTVVDSIFGLLTSIVERMPPMAPEVSAILLLIIVVGLIGLLFRMLGASHSEPQIKRETLEKDELEKKILEINEKEVAELKKTIVELEATLEKSRLNPNFTATERVYFNINGIANAGLIFAIATLIFEYLTLGKHISSRVFASVSGPSNKKLLQTISENVNQAITAEVGRLMFVLLAALLVSSLLVLIAHERNGRSPNIINRAFVVSLIAASILFAAFLAVRTQLIV